MIFLLLAVLYNSCSLPARVVLHGANYFWFWFLSQPEFQIWKKSELEQVTCTLNTVFLQSLWCWHQHRSHPTNSGQRYRAWHIEWYNLDDIFGGCIWQWAWVSFAFQGPWHSLERGRGNRVGGMAIGLSPAVSVQLRPWRASNRHLCGGVPVHFLLWITGINSSGKSPVIFQWLMLSFSFLEGCRTWPLQSYDLVYSELLRTYPSKVISLDPIT